VRTEAARALEALVPIYQITRRHIQKDSSKSFHNGSFWTLVYRTLIIVFSNVPLHEPSFSGEVVGVFAVVNSIRAHLKRKIAWRTCSFTQ
jgi:hypothetical protein